MTKAVIFDCDGVLVDSEVLSMRGERVVLQGMGLDYSPQDYIARFVGMHDTPFLEALRADYRERLGRPAPDDFEERLLDGRRREMVNLTVIDGAGDALTLASRLFGQIAIASSSRAHFLESKLQRTGLRDLAGPHVYSADLVKHAKPAPDIFLYTADRLGVAPADCLVLEDSRNGVTAAVAAGMEVWGFAGGGHCFDGHGDLLIEAGASRVVADFAQFGRDLDEIAASLAKLLPNA